jgi:NTE family protein
MSQPADAGAEHDRIALLLQGGGALGTYQLGVFEGLSEAGYTPDWVCGTSIGAIQSAIIAGNPPEQRLERLHEFWERITWPQPWPFPPADHPWRQPLNIAYAMGSALVGQPGFFTPRMTLPSFFAGTGAEVANGVFDTTPLRSTLLDLVDFDCLNDGPMRVSLGAVDIDSGRHVFFDSRDQRLDVRHVMASAALPPAFPSVEIDGHHYWDGGILSNTPLDVVLDDVPRRSTLCFMVDLFDPVGVPPKGLDQVEDRRKDISFASRSAEQIEQHRQVHNLRRAVTDLYEHLPPEQQRNPEMKALRDLGCTTTMNIVHFIYRGQAYRSWAKDFTFLRQTLEDHRRAERLAEGLSHLAEEVVGHAARGASSRSGLGFRDFSATREGLDVFNTFHLQNFGRLQLFLLDPAAAPALSEVDPGGVASLRMRGHGWLLVRWLADRFATPETEAGLIRRLSTGGPSALTGIDNVTAAAGVGWPALLEDFALVPLLEGRDLPAASERASRAQLTTWELRDVYAGLSENPGSRALFPLGYPLDPAVLPFGDALHSLEVEAGTARYMSLTSASSSPALSLSVSGPGGLALPADAPVRVTVVRFR